MINIEKKKTETIIRLPIPEQMEILFSQPFYKANSITLGCYSNNLNAGDLKIMNFLLYLLQIAIQQNRNILKCDITLEFPDNLYKFINKSRNWRPRLKIGLEKLANTKIKLSDCYYPYVCKELDCLLKYEYIKTEKCAHIIRVTFSYELVVEQSRYML